MCLDLIKCATNSAENLQEKKNYPARCFFLIRVDCGWMVKSNSFMLSREHGDQILHPPAFNSIPDFRVGVGLEVVYEVTIHQMVRVRIHSLIHSIHSLVHSVFIYLFSRHCVKNGNTQ